MGGSRQKGPAQAHGGRQYRATGQELATRITADTEADKHALDRDLAGKGWAAADRRAAPEPTALSRSRGACIPSGVPSGARLDGAAAWTATAHPSPSGQSSALDVARSALAPSGPAELEARAA